MKSIDCRTMSCPLPVVTVKRALEAGGGEPLTVLLDDGAPRENVARFAASRGYSVSESPIDDGFSLVISGQPTQPSPAVVNRRAAPVVLVTSDRLGDGPEELGRLLMKNFIITLLDLAELPDRIFFLNSGVFLTTEGSELLEALEKLGNRGVEVFSCGVCLDFFQRKDQLKAGSVTNMFTIAEALVLAGSVIRP
ncbi:sulfurtransferase-like selenium metabolism protein YedF [Geobacter argillaceus]|uniref:Selenium metabolism protein YedF n=1 Tax=Geobacter argillaceus TaxID=345631 RepID=A0A562V7R4_9BACT|nr:sulfurtransferase-like selenium metabolism protein YedF [Geobacter argillaceus]TWJ13929.1 selenium metabolism protein YedF [Geobacter argillaceus]